MYSTKITEIRLGLTILFWIVSLLEIVGVVLHNTQLQLVFKPMIMLSLIALYYFSIEKVNKWYSIALLFSFFGDVLLLDKNNMFLYGIAAFLITQLLYIKIINSQLQKSDFKQKSKAFVPFILFFILLLIVVKENLGSFLVPVVVYGIAISFFGAMALLNYLIRKTKRTQWLLFGAILFISSDSMIALHKFHEPKSFYPTAIMVTYILAQYLIYNYMLSHVDTD